MEYYAVGKKDRGALLRTPVEGPAGCEREEMGGMKKDVDRGTFGARKGRKAVYMLLYLACVACWKN